MKIKFTILYLLLNLLTYSQENILSGYIKDGKTGEVLIGARNVNGVISNFARMEMSSLQIYNQQVTSQFRDVVYSDFPYKL